MGGPLFGVQVAVEPELLWLPGGAPVGQLQAATCLLDQGSEPLLQPTRQEQVAGECLVVATQEARGVPRGGAAPLTLVEDRVGHRRRVLERGQQRRWQLRRLDGDGGAELGTHHCGRLHGDFRGRGGCSCCTSTPTATWPSRRASRSTS